MQMKRIVFVATLGLALLGPPLAADGGIVFDNIALDPATGITYERTESARQAFRDALVFGPPIPAAVFFDRAVDTFPQKGRGAPGVALFDHDLDGDLDIYVTNGPGTPNSLYSNQFVETGSVSFVDVGLAAGVGATSQDSSGVCFGDIDNDGDSDLYVVSTGHLNQLFENNGDGTFTDISSGSGAQGEGRYATACTMADFDGDGLLDITVANTYDSWDSRIGLDPYYPNMEHNYLFMNQGGNTFTDESAARGLENLANTPLPGTTGAGFTWAITSVDFDQDGDIDIINSDNQGGAPTIRLEERGWNRIFENDGTGHFTDTTIDHGLDVVGGWMGIDFGDLNCDGSLDFFATDLGYGARQPSRWFYGSPTKDFTDSGAGDLLMTPFGWGTSIFDYDNDGDSDILFHGGMDIMSIVFADNPGTILTNTGSCSSDFDWDQTAVPFDHRPRVVEGVAVGDLNHDGFEDVVTVASIEVVPNFFFPIVPFFTAPTGSVFDSQARFENQFGFGPFRSFLNPTMLNGNLTVELSSADNGNGWADVNVRGGVGVHPTAGVNRDGIGAVVSFTPDGGPTSMRPISGGSSYASQDALTAHFGLGAAETGTVDVLWPGGVRNRLYDVAAGEQVLFPEIPCSFDASWSSRQDFRKCVRDALKTYRHPSVDWISNPGDFKRFEDSMLRAFDETQP